MTTVINPAYEHLREWIQTIPSRFAFEGEVIYNDRNQIRLFTVPDGLEMCVKRFRKPSLLNRIVYTCLRPPKAKRAYGNALTLLSRGIATPEPVAYILCGNPLLDESYLITRKSTLTRNFYEFGDGNLEGKEPILRAFARYTASAHEAQVYHLDYSPGNILFDRIDGEWRFEMIDINRIETRSHIGIRKGCSNFARLWGKEELHRIIAAEYASSRGFNPAQCTEIALLARERFWRKRPHPFFVYN